MNEIEYLQDLAGVQITEIPIEYGEILEEEPTYKDNKSNNNENPLKSNIPTERD